MSSTVNQYLSRFDALKQGGQKSKAMAVRREHADSGSKATDTGIGILDNYPLQSAVLLALGGAVGAGIMFLVMYIMKPSFPAGGGMPTI